jgi:multidrug transporter EmrE-like cation transporter
MDLKPMALLLTGGMILTVGDIVMKKWVATSGSALYIAGLAIYLVGLNFLVWSFKYKNIAVASVMFVFFNVVTLMAASWLFFKEGLSVQQIVGVSLGLASVAILELA